MDRSSLRRAFFSCGLLGWFVATTSGCIGTSEFDGREFARVWLAFDS